MSQKQQKVAEKPATEQFQAPTETTQRNEVVRVEPPPENWMATVRTNLDLKSHWGRATAINCANPGEIDFDDAQRTEKGERYVQLKAIAFMCFPQSSTNIETGEIHDFTRTCFITRDHGVFRTTSPYAPGRMQALLALYTAEEWASGIRFQITEKRGKGKGIYHEIKVIP